MHNLYDPNRIDGPFYRFFAFNSKKKKPDQDLRTSLLHALRLPNPSLRMSAAPMDIPQTAFAGGAQSGLSQSKSTYTSSLRLRFGRERADSFRTETSSVCTDSTDISAFYGPGMMSLPYEVWARVVHFLPNPTNFTRLCRWSYCISKEPTLRRDWLLTQYGRLALYYGLKKHKNLLTLSLAELLIQEERVVPRFFCQLINRTIYKPPSPSTTLNDSESQPQQTQLVRQPTEIERLIILQGYHLYGDESGIACDDIGAFEQHANNMAASKNMIRELIVKYGFVPLEELTPMAALRIYQIAKLDMLLLSALESNGLHLRRINNPFMKLILRDNHASIDQVRMYISRGMRFTKSLVSEVIREGFEPSALQLLESFVPQEVLFHCSRKLLQDFMGPSGHANIPAMSTIVSLIKVPESYIEEALMNDNHRGGACFTRCYEQPQPAVIWTWVLNTYGAKHRFSVTCFDDLITWVGELGTSSRAAYYQRDPSADPMKLVLSFVASGCRIQIRHVKSIAHGALQSASDSSAQIVRGLMQRFCGEIYERKMTETEKTQWISAWKDAILMNQEWKKQFKALAASGSSVYGTRLQSFATLRGSSSRSKSPSIYSPDRQDGIHLHGHHSVISLASSHSPQSPTFPGDVPMVKLPSMTRIGSASGSDRVLYQESFLEAVHELLTFLTNSLDSKTKMTRSRSRYTEKLIKFGKTLTI
ncbi:uncharacterized protein BJ171DRAFT_583943 [Polychytrium aggregatum]|uniref:uncharacterized protein n=1 Tax=Polychytrium aggregatum TaxID=110093 RepID=UPI0022FDEF4C|nr:uncharacterized protein BJ171DRAFT_583943 [Polychytrium aggregatum]KAI9202548.1 hypothetical protein BJ171DRAFT_583943 [Polychytrium aggregatum]